MINDRLVGILENLPLGRIVHQRKPKATYVQLETDRTYLQDMQYTNVKHVGIGKLIDEDNMLMLPNENFLKFFPTAELPETRDRDFCAPELTRRLHELDVDESISARVCSALTELLPGGEGNTDGVARKLGLSRRTLQRKLEEEGTTFQQQLNHTRELLAKHYLRNTELSVASIAYLLGFRELNSFQRSFSLWTGMSVGQFRKANQQGKEENT